MNPDDKLVNECLMSLTSSFLTVLKVRDRFDPPFGSALAILENLQDSLSEAIFELQHSLFFRVSSKPSSNK